MKKISDERSGDENLRFFYVLSKENADKQMA